MEIRVNYLNDVIKKYNNLIETYENINMNLFNELGNASSYWNDGYSLNFFENIRLKKIKISNNIKELKELNNLYLLIIDRYNKFGQNIRINLEEYSNVNKYFNNYISKINNIIAYYNRLDLSYFDDLRNAIYTEKNKLVLIKNNMENLKEYINNYFIEIEEIEKEINLNLSKLNISYIEDNFDNTYKQSNNSFMDIDNMLIINNKLKMYKNEERLTLEDIIKELSNIKYYYKSNITNRLENINNYIGNNFNNINRFNDYNTNFIEENIYKYQQLEIETSKNFNDIG